MWLIYGCAAVNGRSPLLPASEVNLTCPLRNSNGGLSYDSIWLIASRPSTLSSLAVHSISHSLRDCSIFLSFVLLSAKSPISNSSCVARARGVTRLYAVTSQTACIDGSILRQAGCCIASSTFRFRQSKPSTRAAGPGGMYFNTPGDESNCFLTFRPSTTIPQRSESSS